jgi:hypothetical protein
LPTINTQLETAATWKPDTQLNVNDLADEVSFKVRSICEERKCALVLMFDILGGPLTIHTVAESGCVLYDRSIDQVILKEHET